MNGLSPKQKRGATTVWVGKRSSALSVAARPFVRKQKIKRRRSLRRSAASLVERQPEASGAGCPGRRGETAQELGGLVCAHSMILLTSVITAPLSSTRIGIPRCPLRLLDLGSVPGQHQPRPGLGDPAFDPTGLEGVAGAFERLAGVMTRCPNELLLVQTYRTRAGYPQVGSAACAYRGQGSSLSPWRTPTYSARTLAGNFGPASDTTVDRMRDVIICTTGGTDAGIDEFQTHPPVGSPLMMRLEGSADPVDLGRGLRLDRLPDDEAELVMTASPPFVASNRLHRLVARLAAAE